MRTRSICKRCHRMRAIGRYCAQCARELRALEQPKTVLTPPPAEPPPPPPIKTDIPTTTEIQPPGPAPASVAGPPPKEELPPNVRVLTLPTPPAVTQMPTGPQTPFDSTAFSPFILPNIEDDEKAVG